MRRHLESELWTHQGKLSRRVIGYYGKPAITFDDEVVQAHLSERWGEWSQEERALVAAELNKIERENDVSKTSKLIREVVMDKAWVEENIPNLDSKPLPLT